jgi:hypothetical protein
MKKALVLAALLTCLLTACSALWPGQTVKPTAQSGQVIFQDDFSNSNGGWETWSDKNGSYIAYQSGGLRMFINQTQYDYWTTPSKTFGNTRVEVDAAKLGGPDDNDFGVICRFQNRDNYYALLAGSDGYAGIIKVKAGEISILSGKELVFSESIQRGQAGNRLRADCSGSNLALYANGQLVAQAVDPDFVEGEIGLTAGAFSQPGVDIYFDNLTVYQP